MVAFERAAQTLEKARARRLTLSNERTEGFPTTPANPPNIALRQALYEVKQRTRIAGAAGRGGPHLRRRMKPIQVHVGLARISGENISRDQTELQSKSIRPRVAVSRGTRAPSREDCRGRMPLKNDSEPENFQTGAQSVILPPSQDRTVRLAGQTAADRNPSDGFSRVNP